MAKIGIFWVYMGTVLGKACELRDGEEGVPGILDSPESHVDLWPIITTRIDQFPLLGSLSYEDVPRGRVLFDKKREVSVIYLDKTLDTAGTRTLIGKFFDLDEEASRWESDPHYTTDRHEMDAEFE